MATKYQFSEAVCERLHNIARAKGVAESRIAEARQRRKDINEILQGTGVTGKKRTELQAEALRVARWLKELNGYLKGTIAAGFDTIKEAKQGQLFADDAPLVNYAEPVPVLED